MKFPMNLNKSINRVLRKRGKTFSKTTKPLRMYNYFYCKCHKVILGFSLHLQARKLNNTINSSHYRVGNSPRRFKNMKPDGDRCLDVYRRLL